MENETTLPFDDLKQNALLGHLLINEKFFKMVYKKIKPSWFLSERTSKIYKMLVSYYEFYQAFPKRDEIKGCSEMMSLDLKERNLLCAWISNCILNTQQVRLETIKPDLTEWLHAVILMKAMHEAQDSYNQKKIKQCHLRLMEAVKEISNTNFDRGNEMTFSNYNEYLKQAKEEKQDALTTGLSLLDKALLQNATNGGLQRGDTTIIMAPVNVGKTTCLITIACHNILASKDVLFMTHEGRPEDIRLKFLANLLDCEIHQLFDLYQNENKISQIEMMVKKLDKHLKYLPYNKPGMTIEEVVPIIVSNQEEWVSNHDGKGFDMLVSDYPALLTTEIAKRGNLQKRNVDQVVYNNYVQMALEYKWHSLLAIQTNREGSKINKGLSGDDRLLVMEDVKESWDPIAEASNVLTLNRGPKEIANNTIIYNVAKCRSNKTGIAIFAKSNFAHCKTHSESLGGTEYSGTNRPAMEITDEHLIQFNNQRLPSTLTNE